MFKGFDAVYNKHSKVLILGSFPSVKSREQGFYYGNKQNRFWKMLELCFNEKIENNIDNKKYFLLKHNIALFDVVIESDLKGSADLTLSKSNKKIADLSFLLPPNTDVQKILCNGKTSFDLVVNNLKTNIPINYMPSTSPANPRFNYEIWIKELSLILKNKLKKED